MKTVKSLLLGSAAGFVAISGAQAADLPMAEPVEYVKVCSTYGEGFFYIPGTDTCLQISGKARADFLVTGDDTPSETVDFVDNGDEGDDDFLTDVRGVIAADARSETEWGTLRAYIEFEGRSRGGVYSNGRGDVAVSANGTEYDVYGPGVQLISAFVQFAGITAGYAPSFFDFVEYDTIYDFFSKEDVNTLAYTASFGSGFAATIAIEDKYFRASSSGTADDLDQVWPNIVAALRIDQAWGSAQISAAVQDNEGDGASVDDTGWAVQAGVAINLPTAHEGSKVFLQGAYSEGALSYAGNEDWSKNSETLSLGLSDQTAGANNELWAVGGGVAFQASEEVRANVIGLYAEYTDDTADLTTEFITVEGNVVWSPVDNLDIYLAGIYLNAEDEAGDEVDSIIGVLRFERGF